MFRGMYTATAGMIANERYQQMLTQNLANAETPGYKREQAVQRSFPELLIQRINAAGHVRGGGATPVGSLHTGVYTQEGVPSFQQGSLQQTGRLTDVAIVDQSLPVDPETGRQGHLFFAVDVGDGTVRYTRNGNFILSDNGTLLTPQGYAVLDEDENQITITHENFRITGDGSIIMNPDDPESMEELNRLWLGYTHTPERLVKEGNGLLNWIPDNAGEAGEMTLVSDVDFLNDPEVDRLPYELHQGFIERSNVDVSRTMTQMLSTFRLYEANQRVIQAYDRTMELSSNSIGRIG